MYALRSLGIDKKDDGSWDYTQEETESGQYRLHDEESKRAKGINKSVTKKHICLQDYIKVLEEAHQSFVFMKTIRSSRHQLHTEQMYKKAISGFCTKRYSLDAVNSLAHGNFEIRSYDDDN
jgi:hypothetical protein